jgi:hypothetical protein
MPNVPDYLVAAADRKCYSAIDVNIAENLATFEQSLKSMSNLVVKGLHYLAKFRGLMVTTRNPKVLADLWLTYQYGLKPLVSDIVKLQKFHFQDPGFAFARGQASEVWDRSGVILNNSGFFQTVAMEGTRWGCNTQVAYTVDSPLLAGLSSLGLTNPTQLFWELTLFSFIVDWFINVGQVISSIAAGVGLTFLWGSRTRWLRPDYEVRWRPSIGAAQTYTGRDWGETGKGLFYHREVLDSFPVPPLTWGSGMDLTKLLNAIAIFKR